MPLLHAGRHAPGNHLLHEPVGNVLRLGMPDGKPHFPFSVKDDLEKFSRISPLILPTVADTDAAWLSTACLREALIPLP